MIVPVHPPVEGIAAERFRALARQLMQAQQRRRQVDFDEVCSQEIRWCLSNPHLDGCRDNYEAAIRVLVDLARLNWTIQENRFGVELQAPSFLPKRGIAPDEVMRSKQAVRYELSPLRDAQFRNPSVRDFIQRLENPTKNSGRKSVLRLVADGRELRARLQTSLATAGDERVTQLAEAIRPYLQLVDADEPEEHTGILQGEVWRYFRYTWSLPATSIPGRQLLYLVRDAAHPHHAVMGIAALSNCAMQMRERDNFIGWTTDTFSARVEATLGSDSPARDLSGLFTQLEDNITDALADVEARGLATRAEIKKPTAEIVARLRRLSQEFAAERQEALEEIHDRNLPFSAQETEAGPYGVPLAEEVLSLEKKVHDQPEFRKARAAMVAKKRALELSRLLQARLRLREIKERFLDPTRTIDVLYLEETRMAIAMALMANKSRRVGANMLELTTCGAIPPYNHLLAGKLTALLLLSPQVADHYRRRYGSEPSIISSLLKNAPLVRDSTLVYLGTTSLYALGSSQYERLRLPAGIIAPDQPELHYERVGYTSGYGTVQFAPETAQAVETVVMKHAGFREVNSIFGEGPSPRLRKLRTGLKLLGFDPENLLRHNQHRLIYGVPLAENALAFMRGEGAKLPDYLKRPGRYRNATERIAAFWTRRWLASRLNHTPAIESLAHTPAWKLSDQIPVAASASAAPVLAETSPAGNAGQPSSEVEFWRSIAHAGPEVCSDELTQEEINRLHVKRPLEDFLVRKMREGFSLVLTGNAGDGKTHLFRRLQEQLAAKGIEAVVEPDATAAMKHGELAPVLDGWRKALAAKKPYLIAANEYPLYQLRKQGMELAPSLAKVLGSVDSQCRARLAYGAPSPNEDAADKVLVIDLSLRNPLQPDFAGALLDRLLQNKALQQHARADTEPNFTRNFERLSQPRVREQLLGLFQRLVVRGERAPVRELWIILARLLFGSRLVRNEVPDAMNARYSERLFERDDRFRLSQLLAELADPAACSHPQWDARLEQPASTKPSDWMESREPMPGLRELDLAGFSFLKRVFYFEHALGYEPFRMKPVHFAAGFFLSVAGGRYELEPLNKTAVIKHKTGLRDDYTHENLLVALKEEGLLDASVKESELKALRLQLNGVVGNDDAIYGSFAPYKKPPGVAYTMVSDRLLYDHDPLDGYSGYFAHSVLNATPDGEAVVGFAKQCLDNHTSTLERLVAPLLAVDEPRDDWNCRYEERFGKLAAKQLKQWAALMAPQTKALATLCRNLESGVSHSTKLRCLVMGLCSWLFIYLHKRAAKAHGLKRETPLLVMDFLGNANARLRATSRFCFARQRGRVFESYGALRNAEAVNFDDELFAAKSGKGGKSAPGGQPDFSFLEQHYSDLSIRIGFAQPRAQQARRKHFELQPDTARLLLLSLITPENPLLTFEELAALLRKVWGVCLGGCNDDLATLRASGYEGLDEDADLEPNRNAFVDLLKRLNLATEPSDGLVLCAVNPEELP